MHLAILEKHEIGSAAEEYGGYGHGGWWKRQRCYYDDDGEEDEEEEEEEGGGGGSYSMEEASRQCKGRGRELGGPQCAHARRLETLSLRKLRAAPGQGRVHPLHPAHVTGCLVRWVSLHRRFTRWSARWTTGPPWTASGAALALCM